MQRAKLGTHSGDIADLFAPYHTSMDAPDLEDVTDENVMKLIQTVRLYPALVFAHYF